MENFERNSMIYKEFFTFNLQPSALCQKAKVYTAVQRQRRVCGEVMAFHLIKVVHAVSKRVSGFIGIKGSITLELICNKNFLAYTNKYC